MLLGAWIVLLKYVQRPVQWESDPTPLQDWQKITETTYYAAGLRKSAPLFSSSWEKGADSTCPTLVLERQAWTAPGTQGEESSKEGKAQQAPWASHIKEPVLERDHEDTDPGTAISQESYKLQKF